MQLYKLHIVENAAGIPNNLQQKDILYSDLHNYLSTGSTALLTNYVNYSLMLVLVQFYDQKSENRSFEESQISELTFQSKPSETSDVGSFSEISPRFNIYLQLNVNSNVKDKRVYYTLHGDGIFSE
ncbi:hypothetical protein AB6A40_005261 [Gnathostoma spinigerum]|uniref:Uncharacterized protein n=1 Tax=Gnathostoma spinigerum TaxID=75299 RepID=A0ABD6EH51_9BILA